MKEVSSSIQINLPKDTVWTKMRDLGQPHNYVPGVVKTEFKTEAREGEGASRTVHANGGKMLLDETVIDWQEGDGFTLRLHRGSQRAMPIFDEMHFRYAIEDCGEYTLFKPAMIVRPRGIFGRLMFLLAKGKMRQSVADVGLALKEYYESGQPVTPERFKALQAASE